MFDGEVIESPDADRSTSQAAEETIVGDWKGELPPNESPATRQHRIGQGIWRTEIARWPAGLPQNDRRVRARYPTLPNWLAETHESVDVREAGINVMSRQARRYTRERLTVLEQIDGKAGPDRLWRNLLSSQPLAFSVAGHLRCHGEDAAALLANLTGLTVVGLSRLDPGPGEFDRHVLDGIEAEWFPPRAAHTNDMSGADIAACIATATGERALVTIEVKYTDTFSPKPVEWPRYEQHLRHLGLDEEATRTLVAAGCSQVLRQVMMTESVRRRGVAPTAGAGGQVDLGLAVVLAREDDKTARRVVDVLNGAVGTKIPVIFWSHRRLFDAAAALPGLRQWAEGMTVRYLPRERSADALDPQDA